MPLVDGHNDLPWIIHSNADAGHSVKKYNLKKVHQESDTDIPRLKKGMVSAQFWAAFDAFVPGERYEPGGPNATRDAIERA